MNEPVLLTGAGGAVGEAILGGLGDSYEWKLMFHSPPVEEPDHEYVVGDVASDEDVAEAVSGVGAVVHLAGDPRPDAPWKSVLSNNIDGTQKMYDAAIEEDVDRFVYASSNHAVGLYEVENAPTIYGLDHDLVVDHTAPVRPDSMYGAAKVYAEGLGRLAADQHGVSFYSLRICAVRDPEYDHPYGDAEAGVDDGEFERDSDAYGEQVARLKGMWQSRRDHAHMVEQCLHDESVDFDVFYGVSDNDRRWFDIDHARDVLGYEPRDNGEEWDSPPADGSSTDDRPSRDSPR